MNEPGDLGGLWGYHEDDVAPPAPAQEEAEPQPSPPRPAPPQPAPPPTPRANPVLPSTDYGSPPPTPWPHAEVSSRPARANWPIVAGVLVALILLGALGVIVARRGADGTVEAGVSQATGSLTYPSASPPSEPSAMESSLESATSEPSSDPEETAVRRLTELREEDLRQLSIDGRWAAMLASKYVGVVDPYQVTATGSHTFFAADILAEHEALRGSIGVGTRVVLLLSTDYGKRSTVAGQPLWVTFAVGDFASAEEVQAWCGRQFPGLTEDALANRCTPRTIKPIGG